jgi:hypothetical protein
MRSSKIANLLRKENLLTIINAIGYKNETPKRFFGERLAVIHSDK